MIYDHNNDVPNGEIVINMNEELMVPWSCNPRMKLSYGIKLDLVNGRRFSILTNVRKVHMVCTLDEFKCITEDMLFQARLSEDWNEVATALKDNSPYPYIKRDLP